jgi:hypothetical protein
VEPLASVLNGPWKKGPAVDETISYLRYILSKAHASKAWPRAPPPALPLPIAPYNNPPHHPRPSVLGVTNEKRRDSLSVSVAFPRDGAISEFRAAMETSRAARRAAGEAKVSPGQCGAHLMEIGSDPAGRNSEPMRPFAVASGGHGLGDRRRHRARAVHHSARPVALALT